MLLTDGDRIRGLLGTYWRLVDADEVAALYAGIVRRHDDGTPRTQHAVANTVFDEPAQSGDAGAARATSTYLVLQATAELPLQVVVTGTYVDTFAQAGSGAWHFTERRLRITHQGDLAHHLAPGVVR